MNELGRTIIIFGAVLIIVGLVLLLSPKIPFLGKLPGDFLFKKDGFTFYFPLATSIILSILLTILIIIFLRR